MINATMHRCAKKYTGGERSNNDTIKPQEGKKKKGDRQAGAHMCMGVLKLLYWAPWAPIFVWARTGSRERVRAGNMP